jgi:hypothetical protein
MRCSLRAIRRRVPSDGDRFRQLSEDDRRSQEDIGYRFARILPGDFVANFLPESGKKCRWVNELET